MLSCDSHPDGCVAVGCVRDGGIWSSRYAASVNVGGKVGEAKLAPRLLASNSVLPPYMWLRCFIWNC